MAGQTPRRNWSREETLAAFVLYMRIPPNKFDKTNKTIISFANAIGRTPDSVALKLGNLEFFDPNKTRKGNEHGSKLDRAIWDEYDALGDALLDEAIEYYIHFTKPKEPVIYEGTIEIDTTLEGIDVVTVTTRRLHQDHFRNLLFDLYDGRCCVTNLNVPQLLIASHIKPWRESDSATERVNVENGLLLNSLHDKAFDCGLISLNNDFEILISDALEERIAKDNSEALQWLSNTRGRRIRLPETHKPNLEFIEYHRTNIFKG